MRNWIAILILAVAVVGCGPRKRKRHVIEQPKLLPAKVTFTVADNSTIPAQGDCRVYCGDYSFQGEIESIGKSIEAFISGSNQRSSCYIEVRESGKVAYRSRPFHWKENGEQVTAETVFERVSTPSTPSVPNVLPPAPVPSESSVDVGIEVDVKACEGTGQRFNPETRTCE